MVCHWRPVIAPLFISHKYGINGVSKQSNIVFFYLAFPIALASYSERTLLCSGNDI